MADALLRSQTSPLTTFLAPAASARLAFRPAQRAFATSARRFEQADSKSAPPPAQAESKQASPDAPSWAGVNRNTSRIIPQKSNNAEDDWLSSLDGGVSSKDLAKGFNAARKELGPDSPLNKKTDFKLDNIFANDRDGKDINEMMQKLSSAFTAQAPRVALRLRPKTGRTVSVGAGVDVGRAFNLLGMMVARNRVKGDSIAQKFHERPGLKRKRLRKQRWRRRFMEGFKATIARVKEMKRQGW